MTDSATDASLGRPQPWGHRWSQTTAGALRRADLAALAAAVVVFQMAGPWVDAYRPGADESYQLQAGHRLYRGLGFTSVWPDRDWPDVAVPVAVPLTNWPATWGLLFAGLLVVTGGSLEGAATGLLVVKSLAALAGTYGWLRLANGVMPPAGVGMMALALAGLFFGDTPFGNAVFVGPSHLLMWAVVPWWMGCVMRGLGHGLSAPGGPGNPWWRAWLMAGALGGLAVLLRYAAVALAVAGAVAALGLLRGAAGNWGVRRRLIAAGLAAGLPLFTLGALAAANAGLAGRALWILDDAPAAANWDNLWHPNVLTAGFAFGFGLEETVYKLRPTWRETAPPWVWLPWYALLGALGWGCWRAGRDSPTPAVSAPGTAPRGEPFPGDPSPGDTPRREPPRGDPLVPLTALAAILIAATVALLMAAGFRTGPEQGFSPLADQRYYGEVLPAAGLAWLAWWARGLAMGGRQRGLAVATAVIVAAVVALEVRFAVFAARGGLRHIRWAIEHGRGGRPPLHTWLEDLADRHRPHRALDWFEASLPGLVWRDRLAIRALRDPDGELPRTANSARCWVMVVVRWDWDRKARRAKVWRHTDRAWRYARFLLGDAPPVVATVFDDGQLCVVYAGWVEPFTAGTRAVPPAGALPPSPGVTADTRGFPP